MRRALVGWKKRVRLNEITWGNFTFTVIPTLNNPYQVQPPPFTALMDAIVPDPSSATEAMASAPLESVGMSAGKSDLSNISSRNRKKYS